MGTTGGRWPATNPAPEMCPPCEATYSTEPIPERPLGAGQPPDLDDDWPLSAVQPLPGTSGTPWPPHRVNSRPQVLSSWDLRWSPWLAAGCHRGWLRWRPCHASASSTASLSPCTSPITTLRTSHAIYGDDEAQIGIESGSVMRGSLPRRASALVGEWLELHRDELLDNWRLAQEPSALVPIEPLP